MRISFVLLAAMALCACQPNDTKVKTVKQLLDEGQVLEFTEPGFRHNGCREEKADAKLRITEGAERARIVIGKQGSIVAPGVYSCYRVGTRVGMIEVKNRVEKRLQGEVVVSKISWARFDKVTRSRLKGQYFASAETYGDYMNGLKRLLEYLREDYVTIVEFGYVGGSAVDEKALIDEDAKANQGDGFEETTADGQCLGKARCPNKIWTDASVPKEFQAAIAEGKLGSWYRLNESTGFQQGSTVVLKNHHTDAEGFARAKITKIKRFRLPFLDPKFFVLNGFDFATLRTHIQSENSRLNSQWITVIDLEIVPSAGIQRAAADGCRNTLALNREPGDTAEVKVHRDQAPCSEAGSLLKVVAVNPDDSVLEIPVRVKARLEDRESTTTTLILERLDQTEQELP